MKTKLIYLVTIFLFTCQCFGQVVSITPSIVGTGDARYVNITGDNMTGQLTTTSTITVQGNAFSVGSSTFVVSGGKVAIGSAIQTNSAVMKVQMSTTAYAAIDIFHPNTAPATLGEPFGILRFTNGDLSSGAEVYTAALKTINTDGSYATTARFGIFTSSGPGGSDTAPTETERLTILNRTGNVGIGSTSPSEKLDVLNGNIKTNYGVSAATGTFTTSLVIPEYTVAGYQAITQPDKAIFLCSDCSAPSSICRSTGTIGGAILIGTTNHCQ